METSQSMHHFGNEYSLADLRQSVQVGYRTPSTRGAIFIVRQIFPGWCEFRAVNVNLSRDRYTRCVIEGKDSYMGHRF